jgi:peptide-methionine (S)-S-oxide reductase
MSLMDLINKKSLLPSESEALQGRAEEVEVPDEHFLKGTPIKGPYPEGLDQAIFGMGCFWGVEKKFWLLDGVYTTAVGYSGGFTKNPTYREVCTGMTGHNEVVLVVFDPKKISYEVLLKTFWEDHDPTQGMQQGNDVGTQYRSGAYVFNQEQRSAATDSLTSYQQNLNKSGFGLITTEIEPVGSFYFAEHYHQQYLAKNPDGYCGVDGTGIEFN